MEQRWVIKSALVMYLVAQCLPAFRWGNEWVFGCQATPIFGYFGFGLDLAAIVDPNPNDNLSAIICVLSCGVVNGLFCLAVYVGWRCSRRYAAVLSALATLAAILCLVMWTLVGSDKFVPEIGSFVWGGRVLWLAVGSCLAHDLPGDVRNTLQKWRDPHEPSVASSDRESAP